MRVEGEFPGKFYLCSDGNNATHLISEVRVTPIALEPVTFDDSANGGTHTVTPRYTIEFDFQPDLYETQAIVPAVYMQSSRQLRRSCWPSSESGLAEFIRVALIASHQKPVTFAFTISFRLTDRTTGKRYDRTTRGYLRLEPVAIRRHVTEPTRRRLAGRLIAMSGSTPPEPSV